MNITRIPGVLADIVVRAFQPSAVAGGVLGVTVQQAIRYGVARGLFSNEAGMGSTPHAHARADAKNPHEQGLSAMISVFIDTFIILNLTAFSILSTDVLGNGESGTALTQSAFQTAFGSVGDIFVAVCLLFLPFQRSWDGIFLARSMCSICLGKKAVKFYSMIVLIFIIVGSTLKVDLVWGTGGFL